MGRQIDWNKVPRGKTLPECVARATILSLTEGLSRGGYCQYTLNAELSEPNEVSGLMLEHNFVIGNSNDPEAKKDETWIKSGFAKAMRQMLEAAQVPLEQDMDVVCQAAAGRELIVVIRTETEPELNRDGSPNQYAGNVRNRFNFFKLGTRDTSMASTHDAAPQAARKPTPQPAPKPSPAPLRPPLGGQSAGRPGPKPAGNPNETQTCNICSESFPRKDFVAHVKACADQAAANG